MSVVALDTSCRLSGSTDDEWKEMDALIPWADAIGGVPLRVFDGKSDASSAAVEEMASRLRWWSDLRDKRGWRADVMVETHDTLFTSDLISRLVELVPDVRILWDSHHTWRRGGEAPEATWKAIRRSVVHVHVKDSIARPSGHHGHTYVLPGTGEFPADALFRAIESEAPLPVLSLEWERRWHPYLPPLEDALEAARARW